MTEKDFYANAPTPLRNVVADALDRYDEENPLDLETYLQAVWSNSLPLAGREPSWDELADVLNRSFDGRAAGLPHNWATFRRPPILEPSSSWQHFEEYVIYQVADLRRMRDGALKDEMRYFGVQSPTGVTWYNFDPLGFLECALAGFSACILNEPIESAWGQFALFLECGQGYE